ncbi:GGDEF domain-containing protein [Bacillus methanolicus]|uniref:putative bifunctional diguanylate cyclase/phosphodiesterase n=1 Tax=Bacillus methanolicus TaxID=1471 RepID=UPI0023807DB8|nr:bifunctional diguanylate cyclase/phosphodiesterase [Bacillus methanolicus]MDE3839028.1 GGDEF domain-containing protein [Bacillus methanolicus]
MKKMDQLHQRNWMMILCLVIFLVVLEDVTSILISSRGNVYHIFDILYKLTMIILLLILLKMIYKTTEELQHSKQKLNSIFDTLDVAIWSHDLKSDILLITPGIEKLYGRSLHEFYQDHDLWKKVIYPEDLYVLDEREQKLLAGEPVTSVYRIIRPDGEVRWIQDRGIPKLDEHGEFVDFTSVLFDITDRKESEERYRSLVEMSPDLIAVISNEKIDYINKAGCKLVGVSKPEEIIGQSIFTFTDPNVIDEIRNRIKNIEDNKFLARRFEFHVFRVDGHTIEVEMSTMPILYEGRRAIQIVGRDITERKQAEKTIHKMAFYDALTGLPNRNKLRQHLNKLLRKQRNQMLALLFLDLDRFKIINDTKGHSTGDLLLQKVAKRLKSTVPSDGLVSRLGGDEFIILLEDIDKKKVTEVAKRILDEFHEPIKINQQEFFVTPSIGISIYPTDGKDEETLIKYADTAMYLAKERGKNNFQFYNSNLDDLTSRKMELENRLRKALEQNQLMLHYQPRVDLATRKIVGVEALIRWKHHELGWISPSEFIPLAEETGLIVPVGKWVLREACKQMKDWQNIGLPPIPIAVNISVRQIQDEQFVQFIMNTLDQVGLDPHDLELEITESIMQNIEKSTFILNQLKALGVKISIDDFGKGYSSLSYLKHLPIDNLKIDKSFVDDIIHHSNQGAIVKTIIDMGHNLNFTVIAEGIEKEEQVKFLIENSCKIGQGFLFSKPLPPEKIPELLEKGDLLN